jgi:hypothetical protein
MFSGDKDPDARSPDAIDVPIFPVPKIAIFVLISILFFL